MAKTPRLIISPGKSIFLDDGVPKKVGCTLNEAREFAEDRLESSELARQWLQADKERTAQLAEARKIRIRKRKEADRAFKAEQQARELLAALKRETYAESRERLGLPPLGSALTGTGIKQA